MKKWSAVIIPMAVLVLIFAAVMFLPKKDSGTVKNPEPPAAKETENTAIEAPDNIDEIDDAELAEKKKLLAEILSTDKKGSYVRTDGKLISFIGSGGHSERYVFQMDQPADMLNDNCYFITARDLQDPDGSFAPICRKEGCGHDDLTCPAWIPDSGIYYAVESEDGKKTVIYSIIPLEECKIDGTPVDQLDKIEKKEDALFEIDVRTGERRCLLRGYDLVLLSGYYNGTLFTLSNYLHGQHYFMIDTAPGEITGELPAPDITFLYLIGIYDGKLYYCDLSSKIEGTSFSIMRVGLDMKNTDVIEICKRHKEDYKDENGLNVSVQLSGSGSIVVKDGKGYIYATEYETEFRHESESYSRQIGSTARYYMVDIDNDCTVTEISEDEHNAAYSAETEKGAADKQ